MSCWEGGSTGWDRWTGFGRADREKTPADSEGEMTPANKRGCDKRGCYVRTGELGQDELLSCSCYERDSGCIIACNERRHELNSAP